MTITRFFLVPILVSCLFLFASGSSPAIKVTIGQTGLDKIRTTAIPLIQPDLQNIDCGEFSGKGHSPVGEVQLDCKEIFVRSLHIDASDLRVSKDQGGLVSAMVSVSVKVNLKWHYHVQFVSDSGSADIDMDKIKMSFTFAMSSQDGHPHANVKCPSVSIDSMHITLHGGASWLYNLFVNNFDGKIKSHVADGLHKAFNAKLGDFVNAKLATIPMEEPIDGVSLLAYELTNNPTYGNDYITTSHLGEIYSQKARAEAPLPAPTLPDYVHNAMMQVILSSFTLNSASFVYFTSGHMNTHLDKTNIPHSVPVNLNTTGYEHILPELYEKYPNHMIQIDMDIKTFPTIHFSPQGARVDALFAFNMSVEIEGNVSPVLSLDCGVDFEFTASMNGNNLVGKITRLTTNETVAWSIFGKFDVSLLTDVINLVLDDLIVPATNLLLSKGFAIPVVDGISLVNPSVEFGSDYILVATDFDYHGGKSHGKAF